jgi:nicotinamide mononucleotide (NMN) deamidase PncC
MIEDNCTVRWAEADAGISTESRAAAGVGPRSAASAGSTVSGYVGPDLSTAANRSGCTYIDIDTALWLAAPAAGTTAASDTAPGSSAHSRAACCDIARN